MANVFTSETKARLLAAVEKSAQIQRDRKSERIKQYERSPSQCQQCGSNLSYIKRGCKFCSRSCAVACNNKIAKRQRKNPVQQKPCLECQSVTANRTFCSRDCAAAHRRAAARRKIEKLGDTAGMQSSTAKKAIIALRGHKCEICHISEWQGQPTPLVLDHIDGNADNGLLANLRVICPNCDHQLPTFAGRNFGKGRHYRRVRYAEGRSF